MGITVSGTPSHLGALILFFNKLSCSALPLWSVLLFFGSARPRSQSTHTHGNSLHQYHSYPLRIYLFNIHCTSFIRWGTAGTEITSLNTVLWQRGWEQKNQFPDRVIVCWVGMFSPSLCGVFPGTLVSSHTPRCAFFMNWRVSAAPSLTECGMYDAPYDGMVSCPRWVPTFSPQLVG